MSRKESDRAAGRARLAAGGVSYAEVKAWAVASGRWTHAEVAALNADAVDAYLAAHPPHPDGVPASPFDALFADPSFWRDLAAQAEAYAPLAPEVWRVHLGDLAAGARGILDLVDAGGAAR